MFMGLGIKEDLGRRSTDGEVFGGQGSLDLEIAGRLV